MDESDDVVRLVAPLEDAPVTGEHWYPGDGTSWVFDGTRWVEVKHQLPTTCNCGGCTCSQ